FAHDPIESIMIESRAVTVERSGSGRDHSGTPGAEARETPDEEALVQRMFEAGSLVALAISVASTIHGCTGDGTDGATAPPGSAGTPGGSGAGGNIFTGSGNGSGDSIGLPGSGAGGGSLDPDAACATSNSEASLMPLNLFIMFDDSPSMKDVPSGS